MLERLRTPRGLALGDTVAITGILTVGLLSHETSPIREPLESLGVILPFLVGWLFAAGLVGLYVQSAGVNTSGRLRLVTVTWIAAANVGLVARSSPYVSGGVTWPFGVVVTGFVLIALLFWRTIAFHEYYATYVRESVRRGQTALSTE